MKSNQLVQYCTVNIDYLQRVCEKVVILVLNFGNKKIFKY